MPQSSYLCVSDRPPLLKTRIALREAGDTVLVSGPGLATLVEAAQVAQGTDDLVRTLKELDTETTRDVEWNVAVHQPGTRVVSWESHDHISTSINSVGITNRWVSQVVRDTLTASRTAANDIEVVTVKMDRMRQRVSFWMSQ